ncbi:MAG: hypothetical protein D6784_18335 [Chloroflexi bacterium]|nr:MAG: hypothetical protein D6784_18335 [Chloroflexota bacterium]
MTTRPTTLKTRLDAFAHARWIGYLAVLTAAAFWGTSGIFVKLITQSSGISAIALAFWRDLTTFAVLLLGGVIFNPAKLPVRQADLPWLAGMGASLGAFHVFWNLGVMLNGAAVTTVQQAAMPAIVTVTAWFLWREPLTWRKIGAIILTFAGTVLVSGVGELEQVPLTTAGLLVGFGVPLFYAFWSLFGKKARGDYDSMVILTYAFGFAALMLLPLQFFTPQPFPVPPVAYVWFFSLIAFSTIIAFFAYTFGLGRLPASVASILAMSEIAFVGVYAYLLLDEQLAPTQILGTVLVVVGVLLLFRRRSNAPHKGE